MLGGEAKSRRRMSSIMVAISCTVEAYCIKCCQEPEKKAVKGPGGYAMLGRRERKFGADKSVAGLIVATLASLDPSRLQLLYSVLLIERKNAEVRQGRQTRQGVPRCEYQVYQRRNRAARGASRNN